MKRQTTNILHLANDYPGSKVYSHLVRAIDEMGIPQTVYTVARSNDEVGRNAVPLESPGSSIIYGTIWRPSFRIFFHCKISAILRDIKRHVDLSKISHIHAHTLFSDGIVAYQLYREYGIPYTVTIRNTDVNVYMRFMIHTWREGAEVIKNASSITCISPAHYHRSLKWISCPKTILKEKTTQIRNGIDDYWLNHSMNKRTRATARELFRFIYVGNFSKNKNVVSLIQATIELVKQGYKVQLMLVGGGGNDETRVKQMAQEEHDLITLCGIVRDKEKLLTLYRMADAFAMVSFHETFGLVYIEAMSQGLPVIYSKGEGIDGVFSDKYGIGVNPASLSSVTAAMKNMVDNYDCFDISQHFISNEFQWENIANQYAQLYSLSDRK